MVKSRMTSLDVKASSQEMHAELKNLRLLNIYSIPPRTFLFRFGQAEKKKTVVLDVGIRLHLTQVVREKPQIPSAFAQKMRKLLCNWKVRSVRQLDHDRVVDFHLGMSEENSLHIVVELFSKGNLVVTDHEYRVKLLFRTEAVNKVTPAVDEIFLKTIPRAPLEEGGQEQISEEMLQQEWNEKFAQWDGPVEICSILSSMYSFGNSLAGHIMSRAGVPNVTKDKMNCSGEEMFRKLLPGMLDAWRLFSSPLPEGGYLLKSSKRGGQEANDSRYDDFSPVLLDQYKKDAVAYQHFPNFSSVCDEFFSYSEKKRIEHHNDKVKTVVVSKREECERNHNRRIDKLKRSEEESIRKGHLIFQNTETIDKIIGLINEALDMKIRWDDFRSVLKQRRDEGHPLASMIKEVLFERRKVVVLMNEDADDDDDEQTEDEEGEKREDRDRATYEIEIDLTKTAHTNAEEYFARAKSTAAKLKRTIAATEKAMAGAERKGRTVTGKTQEKKIITERCRFWWEKFNWFRTSCGDLVLQGRDERSTQLLLRRVMRLGDIFLCCHVVGGLPCILRSAGSVWSAVNASFKSGPDGGNGGDVCATPKICPVRKKSVEEAASWCVSRSPAWESKFTVGAWWVHASQVSGGTSAGCYLYEGEQHDLEPPSSRLGCGLLFRVARISDLSDAFGPPELGLGTPAPNSYGKEGEGDFLEPDTAVELRPLPPLPNSRHQRQGHGVTGEPPTVGPARPTKAVDLQPAGTEKKGGALIGETVAQLKCKQLTKNDRRKLKKIQRKYKDQDEEDCLAGALLNGNKLSRVQLSMLGLQMAESSSCAAVPQAKALTTAGRQRVPTTGDGEKNGKKALMHGSQLTDIDGSDTNIPPSVLRGCDDHLTECGQPGSPGAGQNIRSHPSKSNPVDPAAVNLEPLCSANEEEFEREWVHFTANPRPDDCVQYAVVTCAPMSALESYKYKTELFYGNAKKGQVADSLVAYFGAKASAANNETEAKAICSLEKNEIIEQLRANLKQVSLKQR